MYLIWSTQRTTFIICCYYISREGGKGPTEPVDPSGQRQRGDTAGSEKKGPTPSRLTWRWAGSQRAQPGIRLTLAALHAGVRRGTALLGTQNTAGGRTQVRRHCRLGARPQSRHHNQPPITPRPGAQCLADSSFSGPSCDLALLPRTRMAPPAGPSALHREPCHVATGAGTHPPLFAPASGTRRQPGTTLEVPQDPPDTCPPTSQAV